jgi:nitrate reductase delta subunit
VLEALAALLPALTVSERSEVARLAREGPPEETVGLEPYGPGEWTGVHGESTGVDSHASSLARTSRGNAL